jgi:hypothetical protein
MRTFRFSLSGGTREPNGSLRNLSSGEGVQGMLSCYCPQTLAGDDTGLSIMEEPGFDGLGSVDLVRFRTVRHDRALLHGIAAHSKET